MEGSIGASRAGLILAVAAWAFASTAQAQQTGRRIVVDRRATDDIYLAGDEIEVRAPVDGDVVAAARTIGIAAPVAGDAILAGERVTIEAPVTDDVRAAARVLTLAAPVAGHAVLAGQSVEIGHGQRVEGWAWLTGQEVSVHGSVGDLRASGETVTITGEVRGDAEVTADAIRLAPGAVVRGDLRWSGASEPAMEGARVEGDVVRPAAAGGLEPELGVFFFWIASVILAVLLVVLVAPRWSAAVTGTARTAAWKTLATGIAVLLLAPIVIGLAFFSGVLWIVGLLLLAAYLLALVGGTLLGVVALGDLVLDATRPAEARATRGQRIAAAVLVALLVALLALLPVAGGVVLFVLAAAGIGAVVVSLWRRRRREPIAPIAEPVPA